MHKQRRRLYSPYQIERLAKEMKETLSSFTPEFRSAHDYVYGRRDSRTDENKGQRVSSSGVSDPTGETVVDQEWNRGTLTQACVKLEQAAKDIDAAVALTKRIFSNPDDYFGKLESYRP